MLCVCSTRPMKLREKKYITLMSLLNISGSTSMAGIYREICRFLKTDSGCLAWLDRGGTRHPHHCSALDKRPPESSFNSTSPGHRAITAPRNWHPQPGGSPLPSTCPAVPCHQAMVALSGGRPPGPVACGTRPHIIIELPQGRASNWTLRL